jgi:hypothetical protein
MAMRVTLEAPLLSLQPGQLLSLDDACGAFIEPRDGALWVTEEGERKDHVVKPGERFVVSRPGRTLVQAIDATWVRVREAGKACVAVAAR